MKTLFVHVVLEYNGLRYIRLQNNITEAVQWQVIDPENSALVLHIVDSFSDEFYTLEKIFDEHVENNGVGYCIHVCATDTEGGK